VADVVAKSVGTSNPHNVIHATVDALKHLRSAEDTARLRGKQVGDLLG